MIGLGPGLIHPYSFNVLGQKMSNYPNRFKMQEQEIKKAAEKPAEVAKPEGK